MNLLSSDSDADELSRTEDILFHGSSHSVEQWAYRDGNNNRHHHNNNNNSQSYGYGQTTRDSTMYYSDDQDGDLDQDSTAIAEAAAVAESDAAAKAAAATATRRRKKKKKKRSKVKSKSKSKSKSKFKSKSKSKSNLRSSRSSISAKSRLGKSKTIFKPSKDIWRPAPAKSPTKSQRTTRLRKAQQQHSLEVQQPKKPSVSRLNLSNLKRVSSSSSNNNGTASPTPTARSKKMYNSLNRSAASARSFSGLSMSSQRSGITKRGKNNKEISSLRLRLAGTHNAIRALQEQLHERTAEVDELRAQLLTKTRALEAARAFANRTGGALDRSYSSQTSGGHSSGQNAQARRKYQLQLKVMEKECDQAVIEARKKQQRSIEINADLRSELERLRNSVTDNTNEVVEMQKLLQDSQRALESEKRYSTSLVAQQQQAATMERGENGSSLLDSTNIDDLMTPNVTVRMLRMEVSRLRTLLSNTSHKHAEQENRVLQASGRSKQLEKENSVLRNRVEVGSFGRTNRSTNRSTNNRSTSNTNTTKATNKKKKKKSVLRPRNGTRSPSSLSSSPKQPQSDRSLNIIDSVATKSTVEAQRYAKLKRMFDRVKQ